MSDHSTVATDLTSQYVAQVTSDLERNVKEQERVGAEIADLQQQLAVLQRDHTLLVKMRQALEVATAPAEAAAAVEAAEPVTPAEPAASAAAVAEPGETAESPDAAEPAKSAEEPAVSSGATVPAPRSRSSVTSGAEKPKRTRKKAAASAGAAKSAPAKSAKSARKPSTAKPAGKPSAAKATRTAPAKAAKATPAGARPAKGDAPKLVDLVRRHLGEQKEPRSAAEVAAALGEAHPGRGIKTTVVRSTLEGLVARNQAQRTKQGSSVFYTTPDGSGPAQERAADARS
ncbi:hypothetical protein HTV80_17460 [Streptomyces sp. Vc74B-19]|uniref:hypothetical protein n=1 Tax=unclassified Streptomyces TaxID=2593676 RepID=UPI001BFC6FEC|nr:MULTISPECIES: hypothetical protein [unclassified Streptomyces]MBT3164883.1 hypothetical protein [Streptomyces sp. Vc74B-19]MDU0298819.1 hypothetical protein [Streptomyces sp. PAL114]